MTAWKHRIAAWSKGALAAMIVFFLIGVAAWFTHIVECLSEDRWGFLIAGALFFPIAIIHGIGVWLGVW